MTSTERQNKRAKEQKEYFIYIKGGCCMACGSKEKLNFHHKDNVNVPKCENIARMLGRKSLINVSKEVVKTVLLCEKCHIDLHKQYGKEVTESQTMEYIALKRYSVEGINKYKEGRA